MDTHVTADPSAIADLVEAFATAPPERRDDRYQRLVAAVWDGGRLTDLARSAVPALTARLRPGADQLNGRLAILLGLLAEAEYPATDGEVATAVRQGLDRYLQLWRGCPPGSPLSLALLYLLSHFPDDRERVLAAARDWRLDPDDLARLDRALQRLDPDHPVLGRVFPSPAAWTLSESERAFDQTWIDALTPAQVVESWRKDTRTVLGHTGAKAYWAVRHDRPVAATAVPPPPPGPAPAGPPGSGHDLFARHLDALRCPRCHGRLAPRADAARCAGCGTGYRLAGGILDLLTPVAGGADGAGTSEVDRESDGGVGSDFLMRLSELPRMGVFYETLARPAFLRVSGSNWGGQVSPADERDYVATHVRPVAGPVLDLGAGAGAWTAMLAEAVGADRVVALDPALPMLTSLRHRLPDVPAVRAGAAALPFHDASLGAVNCWNALQAFPDDAAAAIAEVGRCLRPGGTLTLLTFRRSPDPVYRYFQSSHHFPQHPDGLRLFDLDALKGWLAGAGLTVRHEAYPGTFVFLTAERAG